MDSCLYSGYKIPIYYDPMVAKLIVWGHDREDCIKRLNRALIEFYLTGIKSNITLIKNIINHPKFTDGTYTTQFIEKEIATKEQRQLFMFVDERVFLITAAIAAFENSKRKDTSQLNVFSRWKHLARRESLRGQ